MNQQPFYSLSDQTQHITWALPAEPQFRVTRGGLPPDWTPYLHAAVGTGLVGVFILLTICWPHSFRSSARPSARVTLPLPSPSITRMQSAPSPLLTPSADLVRFQGFRVAPSAPTAGRTAIYHYVN